jgi:hypothetical protein
MEAEHRPGAASGQIAKHFSSGAIQERAAVCLDQFVNLVFGPGRSDPDQADHVDLRSIARLLLWGSDYPDAQGDLVTPGIVLGWCQIYLRFHLGLRTGVGATVSVNCNLREEVPLKLQGGGFHWRRGRGKRFQVFGTRQGPR